MIDKNKKDRYGEPLVTARIDVRFVGKNTDSIIFNNSDNHIFQNKIVSILNQANLGLVEKIEINFTYTTGDERGKTT